MQVATRTIIMVWDGLRPDDVNATDTPNLFALQNGGVNFSDNHSTYPTFTMMNGSSFATGSFPKSSGFYGNTFWTPPRGIGNTIPAGNSAAGTPQGYVDPGKVRVVVTRSRASVPGCPDWSGHTADYGANATAPGFGCSINGNLAAMIADPQQLLHGATGTGETVIMSSTKAIETYREAKPTGAAGLPAISSQAGK